MTTPIFAVDGTGVKAPSLAEALAQVRQEFSDIFGEDLAQADQTPQGQLAGVVALLEAVIGETLINLGNSLDPDKAVGAQLDTLYGLLNVLRQVATRSLVTATLTGVAGTGIPAGSRAKTTADAEFRSTEAAILSPTGVSVTFESVEAGPVEAAAGTLTSIVTVIPGWETITNTDAAVPGLNRQSDPAYRASYGVRTTRNTTATTDALESALEEAGAMRKVVKENGTSANEVIQEFTLLPHSVLAIAESGRDADIQRAIEHRRGMGVPTMTAIRGGAHSALAQLQAITAGAVNWNGTDYTGLDLSSATDLAGCASALTTLLAMDSRPPVVGYIDGAFVTQYGWQPTGDPDFADGTTANAFGFQTPASTSPGPFIRTRTRNLTVTMTVVRQPGFPADGLQQINAAVRDVVNGYGVGEQVWSNDLLRAAEGIGGTRVTAISVQYNSEDASSVAVPLDAIWALPTANLTVTIT